MSSYYSQSRLEEERAKALKRETEKVLKKISEQLQNEVKNEVHTVTHNSFRGTVYLKDEAVETKDEPLFLNPSIFYNLEKESKEKREELDFSSLLSSSKKPSKLELELYSWLKRVDERHIVTAKDEEDRSRLLRELEKTMALSSMDIEEKIMFVSMRVSNYLKDAIKLSEANIEEMRQTYFEYLALCHMLEMQPRETLPYLVKREVLRMKKVLEKRTQEEYIMEVLEEIMEELRCQAKEGAVLDQTEGQLFSVEGHPLCDVFVGNDENGIMFEVIGKTEATSPEAKIELELSANSVCALYEEIEERALERGVILKRVYYEEAHIDEMCVQSDVSSSKTQKKRRKTSGKKERALKSEG